MLTIVYSWSAIAAVAQMAPQAGESNGDRENREILVQTIRGELLRRLSFDSMPQFRGRETDDPHGQGSASPGDRGAQPQTLTLEELISFIDLYHPKLRGADANRRLASAKRLEKQGAFDPVISAGAGYLRYNTEFDPRVPRGKPANSRLADVEFGYLTRYGIKIAAGTRFYLGKVKSPLSPTGEGGEYFVEMKIPFLNGARINEKSAAERQALLGEPLADTEYQMTRLDLILEAADAYWGWVAAKRKLDVARNILELAEIRANAVRDRANAGDLPQIDVVEADLEVQRRRGNVITADREMQKSAFRLSLFLWSPSGQPSPIPVESNVPATTPTPVILTDDQAESGRRIALDRRPELRALDLNRDITQIDLELARNQRLPAVDLAISPGRDTGMGSIGNTLKAGLSFSFPFRRRTADGRISAAVSKIQKLEFDLTSERQRITTEVLDAVSAINTAYQRYLVAQREADLARTLEDGERARFALGDSTLFLVNQRERATAEAQIKLIEIQAEYERAVATFKTVTVQY